MKKHVNWTAFCVCALLSAVLLTFEIINLYYLIINGTKTLNVIKQAVVSISFLFLGFTSLCRLYNHKSKLYFALKYISGILVALSACKAVTVIQQRVSSLFDVKAMFNIASVDDPMRTGYFWDLVYLLLITVCCFVPDKLTSLKRILVLTAISFYMLGSIIPRFIYPLLNYNDLIIILVNLLYFTSNLCITIFTFYPFKRLYE